MLSIPAMIAFYEIRVRSNVPNLPSVFRITFVLNQRGLLTIGTVTWLVSSLPQGMIGGLGVAGGLAIHGTSTIANGAVYAGNALVGGAASVAGSGANTVTQGINLIKPNAVATDIARVIAREQKIVAEQATSVATAGVNGAAILAGGATKAVADNSSLLEKGPTVVANNVAQLVSGQQGDATNGPLVPDIAKDAIHTAVGSTTAIADAAIQSVTNPAAVIGATQASVNKNVTKLASVLEGVNPLHVNSSPSESQDPHVSIPVASIVTLLTYPESLAESAECHGKPTSAKISGKELSRFLVVNLHRKYWYLQRGVDFRSTRHSSSLAMMLRV
jgi:hypothetical protein